MNERLTTFFEKYHDLGLKPIVMYPNTKLPCAKGWNKFYNVEFWRRKLCDISIGSLPNLGILLGDIVDVEADCDNSNNFLCDLIGDYPHPCYQSSRSIHHLFLNPDVNLTQVTYQGIEFRGNKVCSVMPPSIHPNGGEYKFLKESRFPIPPMPNSLLNFYRSNRMQAKNFIAKRKGIKKGHGTIKCSSCGKSCMLHSKRLKLEIMSFSSLGSAWKCSGCREFKVTDICRGIRKSLGRRA
jgi:hypothetical protein